MKIIQFSRKHEGNSIKYQLDLGMERDEHPWKSPKVQAVWGIPNAKNNSL